MFDRFFLNISLLFVYEVCYEVWLRSRTDIYLHCRMRVREARDCIYLNDHSIVLGAQLGEIDNAF